jgi:heme/copper-type cytochrome/quinol oxidase subunit 1
MRKQLRPFLTEFFWVTISALTALLIACFIFGWNFFTDTVDLHLHDTYFVISPEIILIPFFLLINFLIYYIKEARRNFSRSIPNIIILITGLLLVAYMTNIGKEMIREGTSLGWTAYPPLSALQDPSPVQKLEHPIVNSLANSIIVFQLAMSLALLYVSFQWGTQWKGKKLLDK